VSDTEATTDREAWNAAFPVPADDVLHATNIPSPWDAFVAGRRTQEVGGDAIPERDPTPDEAFRLGELAGYDQAMRELVTGEVGGDNTETREKLRKSLIDLGGTTTRQHGNESCVWVNAPLDVVLDQVFPALTPKEQKQ